MKKPAVYLTLQELKTFFKVLEETTPNRSLFLRNRCLFYLMYLYGLRINEVSLQLRRGVDLKQRTMTIQRRHADLSNTVPLNEIAWCFLKEYLDSRTDTDDRLFIRLVKSHIQGHSQELTLMTISHWFRRVSDRCHFTSQGRWVGQRPYPAILRQSLIAHMIEAGLPVSFMVQHLGNRQSVSQKKEKNPLDRSLIVD